MKSRSKTFPTTFQSMKNWGSYRCTSGSTNLWWHGSCDHVAKKRAQCAIFWRVSNNFWTTQHMKILIVGACSHWKTESETHWGHLCMCKIDREIRIFDIYSHISWTLTLRQRCRSVRAHVHLGWWAASAAMAQLLYQPPTKIWDILGTYYWRF